MPSDAPTRAAHGAEPVLIGIPDFSVPILELGSMRAAPSLPFVQSAGTQGIHPDLRDGVRAAARESVEHLAPTMRDRTTPPDDTSQEETKA